MEIRLMHPWETDTSSRRIALPLESMEAHVSMSFCLNSGAVSSATIPDSAAEVHYSNFPMILAVTITKACMQQYGKTSSCLLYVN